MKLWKSKLLAETWNMSLLAESCSNIENGELHVLICFFKTCQCGNVLPCTYEAAEFCSAVSRVGWAVQDGNSSQAALTAGCLTLAALSLGRASLAYDFFNYMHGKPILYQWEFIL